MRSDIRPVAHKFSKLAWSLHLVLINMRRLTLEQGVWVCREYARGDNAQEVLRRGRRCWDNSPVPTRQTVVKTFKKIGWEGTCHTLNKRRSGGTGTARTAENIELLWQSLTENGKLSLWQNGLGLSRWEKPENRWSQTPPVRINSKIEDKRWWSGEAFGVL